YADGARIFIEVGPGKVLTALTESCLDESATMLHVEDSGRKKLSHLLCTFAKYIGTGRSMDLTSLYQGRGVKLIQIGSPDQYKKSPALWRINGQAAHPAIGSLPSNGALPISTPLQMKNATSQPATEDQSQPAT